MWFIETPWPPIVICLALAIGLFFQWTNTQNRKIYLYSSVGLLAISVGIFIVERQIVTDKELVEDALIGMTTAFKNDDAKKTLSFIAADADNLVDGTVLKVQIRLAMLIYRIEGYLRISDVSVREGEDGKMISRFRANGTISQKVGSNGGHFSTLWEFTWKKNESDGRWQIIDIHRFDPRSEDPIDNIMAPRLN